MSTLLVHNRVDGARNTVVEISISLDGNDIAPTVILDPKKNYVDPLTPTTKYRVDYINYMLHRDMHVDLWWEVNGDEDHHLIRHLEGRGQLDTESRGGLSNTAGDNKTGCVLLSARGWTAGVPLTGSITIEAVKQ